VPTPLSGIKIYDSIFIYFIVTNDLYKHKTYLYFVTVPSMSNNWIAVSARHVFCMDNLAAPLADSVRNSSFIIYPYDLGDQE
jgi:hypothetical protein